MRSAPVDEPAQASEGGGEGVEDDADARYAAEARVNEQPERHLHADRSCRAAPVSVPAATTARTRRRSSRVRPRLVIAFSSLQ